jgi:hypothetical protein
VYRFDTVADELTCLTCSTYDGVNIRSKVGRVLDDGTVFLTSNDRLVGADVNGRADVYRWQDGEVVLVSPGTGSFDAGFAGVGAGGRDVFFTTGERLVAQDRDGEVDMYDARVDGGLAAQNQAPLPAPVCEGEGCRGPASVPEPAPSASSASFSGQTNAKPNRSHKKKKQKKRHRKSRHAKSKQKGKGHAKRANSNRGGVR